MNRRQFFGTTLGAALVALMPWKQGPKFTVTTRTTFQGLGVLTYGGTPVRFSKYCPSNTIYYLSPEGPMAALAREISSK